MTQFQDQTQLQVNVGFHYKTMYEKIIRLIFYICFQGLLQSNQLSFQKINIEFKSGQQCTYKILNELLLVNTRLFLYMVLSISSLYMNRIALRDIMTKHDSFFFSFRNSSSKISLLLKRSEHKKANLHEKGLKRK